MCVQCNPPLFQDLWRTTISREIAQRFKEAQNLLGTDQAESAEVICADMLAQQPNDANVLCLSAKALIVLERFVDANARIEND